MMKCRHLKKYGHDSCEKPPHFIGGFAEYCYITPGTCVIKVPDNLTDEEVAPANCALATVIAGWEAAAVKPFENVLIQGAGALGFYAAALARHYGCRRIIVNDILDHRLEYYGICLECRAGEPSPPPNLTPPGETLPGGE